jgi:hypothetical protein
MEEFEGPADHARYATWLEQHPEGFVLQCSAAERPSSSRH